MGCVVGIVSLLNYFNMAESNKLLGNTPVRGHKSTAMGSILTGGATEGISDPNIARYLAKHSVPSLIRSQESLQLEDCVCFIVYNTKQMQILEVWHELRNVLNEGQCVAILKLHCVIHLNRQPRHNMWVRRDLGKSMA